MKRNKQKVLLLGQGTYYRGFTNITKILNAQSVDFLISNNHEDILKWEPDITFSFGYRKIIPEKYLKISKKGTVVFHSSDLPKGRGWAPLYYAIVNNEKEHVLSMLFANSEVDAGDIIAKARCKIHPLETINTLRRKDDILVEKLFEKYIGLLLSGSYQGTPQKGESSYYERRYPKDSRIDPDLSVKELLPKLRALPDEYRAFFEINDSRVEIRIAVDEESLSPDSLDFVIEDYLTPIE